MKDGPLRWGDKASASLKLDEFELFSSIWLNTLIFLMEYIQF